MQSRHDEKGGDGMSISASSVTLAAWSSSSVKPNTGWPGAGVFEHRVAGCRGVRALAGLSTAALESLSTVKAEHTRVFRGFRSGWSTR